MSRLPRVLEVELMDTPGEVRAYDAMDHETPKRAFLDRLESLGVLGRCLDIATGPGHIPIQLCERRSDVTVTGIDAAHHMIALARSRSAGRPFADRIYWRIADAKQLPFDAGSFDTVFSNTSLHHIPEPRRMLSEAWRVLKPGGAMLIRDLYRPADEATLWRIVTEQTATCDDDQRKMFADSLRAALTADELRSLAAELNMTGTQVVIDTDRHMSLQKARSI